jgi:hypothetical protein
MPTFDKTGFGLEPVTRMQELLDIDNVAMTKGYSASQLSRSFMKPLTYTLDRITKANLKIPLQFDIGILRGTCANC